MMYWLFIFLFLLIGSTSVLVFVYIGETYPLVIALYSIVGMIMAFIEWKYGDKV